MATKYARIPGGNWSADATWSLTSGGLADTTAPTAADDVILDASSGNVTIDSGATRLARSVDCNGYTGTLTHNITLQIGDGTAGMGNRALRLSAGMTYTPTAAVQIVSSSATQQTITTVGKTLYQLEVGTSSVSPNIVLADAITTTFGLYLTRGTLDTASFAVAASLFSSNNSNVRTLTLGSSAITLTAAGIAWNVNATNLTATANTATATLTGAAASFSVGSTTINWNGLSVVFTGSGLARWWCTTAQTVANITRTGTAAKTDSFQVDFPITVTGTFTVTGNSLTNRMLVYSNTLGTTRTITAGAVSLTNVDFMDITAAGAAIPWTGTSLGDALGNTNITFDTPTTRYWVGGAGNWSDTVHWSTSSGGATGASVPLAQDNVRIDANSLSGAQSINMDMPRACKDLDMTGNTRVSGFGAGGVGQTVYGSVTLTAGYTANNCGFTFASRSSYTITSNGGTFGAATFNGASTGSVTFQDAFVVASTNGINMSGVTFNTNNLSITTGYFAMAGALSNVLDAGTSTITLTATTTTTVWSCVGIQNVNASNATFVISSASTNTRTFAGNGKTYGTLTYTVANSPGSLTITGANTFNTLNVGSGRILTMPASTTNTVTNFNVNGAVNGYVYLPAAAGNYPTAPDSAALDLTGDLDFRAEIASNDWTPSSDPFIIGKWALSTDGGYYFRLLSTGVLRIGWANGAAAQTMTSTASVPATDGDRLWIRGTLDVDDGAGNRVAKFYTSADGAAWTQLGSTITTAGVATITTNTTVLELGSFLNGNFFSGKYYRAQLRNNILDDGTGIVFDANFTTKPVGANSFTESSANAATVTVNGVLAQAGDGRVSLVSSTPSTAATLSKSSGDVNCDYLSISQSIAAGGAGWYAGYNSTDGGSNTGWIFTSPPLSQTITGTSRLTATTTRTETGLARIQTVSLQTQTGKGRITSTTTRTITGVSNLSSITTRTILGRTSMVLSVSQTQTGKSRIRVRPWSSDRGTIFSTSNSTEWYTNNDNDWSE